MIYAYQRVREMNDTIPEFKKGENFGNSLEFTYYLIIIISFFSFLIFMGNFLKK